MIAEYLDRDYVLSETRVQRDALLAVKQKVKRKDKEALARLKQLGITVSQIEKVIAALDGALKRAGRDKEHPQGTAYIPPDPVTCGLQTGLTKLAIDRGQVEANVPESAPVRRSRRPGSGAIEATPPLRLRKPAGAAARARGARATRAPFIEGEDSLYALDGFKAKFGALFAGRRRFNKRPARIASTDKSLSLFLFGDWGTGLPLAAEVTKRIGEQLIASDGGRQLHVIHLGDVYYVGDDDEYTKRMLPYWPVPALKSSKIGSWSINGNHDMYSGGHGYFDTLLRQDFMLHWHGDERGEPSSFFLIEDPNWQIFGLDTSWNLPSLGGAIFGAPTLKDYGGQNGILTTEQAKWMAMRRDPAKGCILITHHQPASSRTSEAQHADPAVTMLKEAGVYSQIDAWIWGHEHRCVVFKPKAHRTVKRLKDAPQFCACLGHSGVPVTQKNFEAEHRIADVLWEEDRLDASAPLYEGQRVVPFGFGRIDTQPGSFIFRIFDHNGQERYEQLVNRESAAAPTRTRTRGLAKPATRTAARKTKAAAKKTKTAKKTRKR